MDDKKREKLAALCHEQWSGWMKYLFDQAYVDNENGRLTLSAWYVERWHRQMNTPYEKLSEEEKDSDRKEADKFIKLLEENK